MTYKPATNGESGIHRLVKDSLDTYNAQIKNFKSLLG